MYLNKVKFLIIFSIISVIFSGKAAKTPRQVTEISNLRDLENFLSQNSNHTFLFVGDNASRDYTLVQKSVPRSVHFLWSKSPEVYGKFNLPNDKSDLFFFRFSKKQNKHKDGMKLDLSAKKQKIRFIKTAVSIFLRPMIENINDKNIDKLLEPGYPSLIIVKSEKENTIETAEFTDVLTKLEKQYRGKLKFFLCNNDEDSNNLLVTDVFHLKTEDLPTAIIIDGLDSSFSADLKKYIFKGKV